MKLQLSLYVLSTLRYPHRRFALTGAIHSPQPISLSVSLARLSLTLVSSPHRQSGPIVAIYSSQTIPIPLWRASHTHYRGWTPLNIADLDLRGKLWIMELALSITHSLSLRLDMARPSGGGLLQHRRSGPIDTFSITLFGKSL